MVTTQITIRVDRVEGNYRENEVALRRELRWNGEALAGVIGSGRVAEIMKELQRMTRSIGVHYDCWRDEEKEERTTVSLPLMIARLEALAERNEKIADRTNSDTTYARANGQADLARQVVEDLKLMDPECEKYEGLTAAEWRGVAIAKERTIAQLMKKRMPDGKRHEPVDDIFGDL